MTDTANARSRRISIASTALASPAGNPEEMRRVDRTAPAVDAAASTLYGFTMLDALPNEAQLPVSWVRQALVEHELLRAARAVLPTLLTPAEFAMHYRPKRTEEWVRDMCHQRRLPGAEKRGRAWLIPSPLLDSGPLPEQECQAAGTPIDSMSAGVAISAAIRPPSRRSRSTTDARY
jgi:hypothetical protein